MTTPPGKSIKNKLQDWFHTSKVGKRFASGAFFSILSAGLVNLSNLAISIFLPRLLGAADWGRYSLIQQTTNTFSAFANFGLGPTANRFVATLRNNDMSKAQAIVRVLYITGAITSTIAFIAFIAYSPTFSAQLFESTSGTATLLLVLSSVILYLNAFRYIQEGQLSGYEAFKERSSQNLISGILGAILTVVATLWFGFWGAVFGTTIASLIYLIVGIAYVRRVKARNGIPPALKQPPSRAELKVLLVYSVPTVLTSIASTATDLISYRMLVEYSDSFSSLGIYTSALRWQGTMLFIPFALYNMVLSMLSNTQTTKDRGAYLGLLRLTFIVNASVSILGYLVIFAFADLIFSFYGPEFSDSASILRIIGLGGVGMSISMVLSGVLASMNKMWDQFIAAIARGVITLVACWLLIPAHAHFGLAYAFLIGVYGSLIIQCVFAWFYLFHGKKTDPDAPVQ